MTRRERRWGVALVGALTLVCVGLLAAEPFLLAATAVPFSYVLYGAVARVPAGTDLRAERRVTTTDPTPGEAVRVTLTVQNVGESTLTDVRVVDGVPDELTVVDGSPRTVASLRPGEEAALEYAVLAKRGTHGFGDPVVRVRPLAATAVATAGVEATGDGALTCANVVSNVPLPDATLPRAGTLPTDSGGSGIEFHATRDYQTGDPVSRIDWRRFAKTNELTTVEYREEQAVRTVLVVDAREVTRVTPEAGYPTGAELGAYAAERLFDALGRTSAVATVVAVGLEEGDVVGGLDPDGLAWVGPAGDGDSRARAARVFDGIQAAVATAGRQCVDRASEGDRAPRSTVRERVTRAADGGQTGNGTGPATAPSSVESILARLPPTAQVVAFSPLLDEWPVALVGNLTARGYPTTVVSPDVTRGDVLGRRAVSLERDLRCQSVESTGAALIDWDLEDPIDIALRASLAEVFRT